MHRRGLIPLLLSSPPPPSSPALPFRHASPLVSSFPSSRFCIAVRRLPKDFVCRSAEEDAPRSRSGRKAHSHGWVRAAVCKHQTFILPLQLAAKAKAEFLAQMVWFPIADALRRLLSLCGRL